MRTDWTAQKKIICTKSGRVTNNTDTIDGAELSVQSWHVVRQGLIPAIYYPEWSQITRAKFIDVGKMMRAYSSVYEGEDAD